MSRVKFRILEWDTCFDQINDSLVSIRVCYLQDAKNNHSISKTGQISEKTIPNLSIQKS